MNRIFVFALLAGASLPAAAVEPAAPALLGSHELTGTPAVATGIALLAAPSFRTAAPVLAIGGETVEAIDLGKLDGERGRADTAVFNDTKLNGDVANNSAVNVNTGSNTIDAGSFANMSGIPVVIQNSGANVLIQNATVINLQFQ
jgi:hypothetical protein